MDPQQTQDQERVRALAQSVDCITEEDLILLTKTKPSTPENWRKRGIGPAYVLIGNRYLYPRAAVAAYVMANVRERVKRPAKDLL
jgi:hypothetical protein